MSTEKLILSLPVHDKSSKSKTEKSKSKSSDKIVKNNKTSYNTTSNDCSGYFEMSKKQLVDIILQKEKIISNYKNKIENEKIDDEKCLIDNENIKNINKKFDFVDVSSGNNIKIKKTSIPCWWCSRRFDNYPCFIVDRYVNGKYFVFGIFCNFSCAMAYNLKSIKDYRSNVREGLTNKFCSELYGKNLSIKPALCKETLKQNGGPLSDKEYDKDSQRLNKKYSCCLPIVDYRNLEVLRN